MEQETNSASEHPDSPPVPLSTTASLLAPLFVIAAAIRIAVNNVTVFSRADETVYLLYAQALAAGRGYPAVVQMFLDDRGLWVFPNPLRWSYLWLASWFYSGGDETHAALAVLSTVAGIAAVALAYWVGRELFGPEAGLIATALVATSPLQLALGRRVLPDGFFATAVLASIACLLLYLRADGRRRVLWLVAWIATTTVAIAAKEQYMFIYPVVLLFWWLRERRLSWREVLIWAAPPFFFFAVYCLLARDVTSFFRIADIITSAMDATYAVQYQAGPPHRLLVDLLAVSPVVTMLMLAALVALMLKPAGFSPELRHIAVLAFGILAVHMLLPSQNLRYISPADPLLRLVVAGCAVNVLRERPRVVVAALAVNAAVELALFYRIFITSAVYDPVTDNLLRALSMLPR